MIDIANLLLASKSGITRIIDRLERNGLVSRAVPPENRRIVYARITRSGMDALGRAQPAFVGAIEESFSRHVSDSASPIAPQAPGRQRFLGRGSLFTQAR